jgi:hypothetical protein
MNPLHIITLYSFTVHFTGSYNREGVGTAQLVLRRATGRTTGLEFPADARILLYSIASWLALWPTQPPIQWVPWAHSPWVKRKWCGSAEVKNGGSIPPLFYKSSWRAA